MKALGALSLVALLLVGSGCDDAEVEPWHTVDLEAEFTADRRDVIRTLEDYRDLEADLFHELDDKVYNRVGTGPEFELARYSSGSAADPRGRDPDWNRSIEWDAENPVGGILLLHGLTDAPYTFRSLGKAFRDQGYHVLAMRLPGHGTAPSGLASLRWEDMAAAVRLGARHLTSKIGDKPFHLVGYSTGAALALDYTLSALETTDIRVPASLILISPAIGIHPTAALAGLKTSLANVPGLGGLAWLQVAPEFDPYKYNSFPTNAGAQVHSLTTSVAERLRKRSQASPDKVLPPTLVFKSTVDATVSTNAVVDRLLGLLAPDRHELVLFDINRFAVVSGIVISDPGPLTARLMAEDSLPFAVTFVTNENAKSTAVVAQLKPPFSPEVIETKPLGLDWPAGVLSLSHVALPFPPDDPLYGRSPPEDEDRIFLGQIALQGERDLLRFPADWLLRLRHNPFYDFLEERSLFWVRDAKAKD